MLHAFKLYTGPDNASHVKEGTVAENDRTERPHEVRHPEGSQGHEKRHRLVRRREEQLGDGDREETVDDKVEPFERIPDRGRRNRVPALWCYLRFRLR